MFFCWLSMALTFCFACPKIYAKMDSRRLVPTCHHGLGSKHFNLQVVKQGAELNHEWSFLGGCRVMVRPQFGKSIHSSKNSGVCCSWLTNSQIASSAFTLGTAAVLPFYTLMVVAPRAELTKKTMKSSIPDVVLGLLYAYLLCLSWRPDTMRLMFASKYWLPELPGIAKMFSSEVTLASAWIHLLVVDLFAARQVYCDGLVNEVETRHSVSMCLLFCPIGILSHVLTKKLTSTVVEKPTNDR